MANKFRDLVEAMPSARKQRIRRKTAELLAELPLRELRRARQLSQDELGQALGVNQATISKMERRADMYISTLRRFVEAMGGELEIMARFREGSVRIGQLFEDLDGDENDDAAA
jgi:transcriptional regulator with XRE-family HTH domain